MTSDAAALSAWTGGVRQPLGLLFLISAVCFNLAYLFLPPTHSVKRLFDRMYINMERDMPPRYGMLPLTSGVLWNLRPRASIDSQKGRACVRPPRKVAASAVSGFIHRKRDVLFGFTYIFARLYICMCRFFLRVGCDCEVCVRCLTCLCVGIRMETGGMRACCDTRCSPCFRHTLRQQLRWPA